MNDLSSLRVLLSAGLALAVSFASPQLFAADAAPDAEATSGTGAALDHPATVLDRYAQDARDARVTSAWWSMGGGAVLVGSGVLMVTSDHDNSGHFVWIAGGLSVVSGLVQLFVPSTLERLESESGGRTPGYTPGALQAAWKVQADAARTQRHITGIADIGMGAVSITAGSLIAGGAGNLSHDDRLAWSVGCLVGGGLITAAGVVSLLVPSSTEKGYQAAFPGPSVHMDVGVAPAPGGGTLQLTGSF